MKSIWQENIEKPKFSALKGDIKTDVLIIGGGMAGLLCGFTLKKCGNRLCYCGKGCNLRRGD